MNHFLDPLWAAAGGWAIARLGGLFDVLAEVATDLGPFKDLSATAILSGLLWFVMRDLRGAVDRNTQAIADLHAAIGQISKGEAA